MSENAGNNWRDPAFKIGDIVMRYNEWRKDYYMPPPSAWLDELLGECVRLRSEVERLSRPATRQDECAAAEEAFEQSGVRPTWPSDEPDTSVRMAAAMAEEIARLRAEVERLRITDEEVEAMLASARAAASAGWVRRERVLLALLSRLGGEL